MVAFDPTTKQEFPTSAKPVFGLLGFLLVVLAGIFVYLYIDAHSEQEKVPEELKTGVEDLMKQQGLPEQPGSFELEEN